MSADVQTLAQVLWSYHQLNQPVKKADCMIVLGNDDLRTAEYAAKLFLAGYADYVVMSGQASRLSSHFLPDSEATVFARVMTERGVDPAHILLEHQATNTGQNILLTQQLLEQHHRQPSSVLLVTKPYMERRAVATFQKVWPGPAVRVTSLTTELTAFLDERHSLERVIQAMIGYVYRMRDYVAAGYQVPQPIPDDVWRAVHQLEALGFQRT